MTLGHSFNSTDLHAFGSVGLHRGSGPRRVELRRDEPDTVRVGLSSDRLASLALRAMHDAVRVALGPAQAVRNA